MCSQSVSGHENTTSVYKAAKGQVRALISAGADFNAANVVTLCHSD